MHSNFKEINSDVDVEFYEKIQSVREKSREYIG